MWLQAAEDDAAASKQVVWAYEGGSITFVAYVRPLSSNVFMSLKHSPSASCALICYMHIADPGLRRVQESGI